MSIFSNQKSRPERGGRVILTFDNVDDVDCGQEFTEIHFLDGSSLSVPNRLIKVRRQWAK